MAKYKTRDVVGSTLHMRWSVLFACLLVLGKKNKMINVLYRIPGRLVFIFNFLLVAAAGRMIAAIINNNNINNIYYYFIIIINKKKILHIYYY